MRMMTELTGREAKWTQPAALSRRYELIVDGDVAATLEFRSSLGSFATARTGDGAWTFKRTGFWRPRATVRVEGAETDLAAFHNHSWQHGGTLELPDGRVLAANTNFWETRYEFRDAQGTPLVTYRDFAGILHLSASVEVHEAARGLAELPWLVPFGCYLAILMRQDSAGAAAAASS